jgi:hypothetical protein
LFCDVVQSVSLENTIIASNSCPAFFTYSFNEVVVTDCDIFGNEGGDWIGTIAERLGADGNFSAPPLFCEESEGDYRLQNDSPCSPEHSEGGVLVGASPVGCYVSAVEPATWGAIKQAFR